LDDSTICQQHHTQKKHEWGHVPAHEPPHQQILYFYSTNLVGGKDAYEEEKTTKLWHMDGFFPEITAITAQLL